MTPRFDRFCYAISFVCVAACQSDAAPPAAGPRSGSAPSAAMAEPMPRAAGALAATMSGGAPAAQSGGAAAGRGGAGSPAAAMSGIEAATPAAAGSGMASSGSAGSGAAPKPAMQPAANPSAAAGCELPTTYTRAGRATLELTWPENLGFAGGAGTLVVWAKLTYTRSGAGVVELEARPCGVLVPPATTSALVGGLKFAMEVPAAAFESPNMPVDRLTATQGEDRSLTFAYGTVLGAMLADPNGAWPSGANLVPFDHDGDGSPGLTMLPLEGPDYATVPSSISMIDTLDRLYVATRARLQVSFTPACSGTAGGMVEPLTFNTSVVGCHVKNGAECGAQEMRFIANGAPHYMAGGAPGAWAEIEIPKDASCADVRAALPPPP